MLRRATPLFLALLLVALPVSLAPQAEAHCPPGSGGFLLVPGISTCPYNQPLEDAVAAANDASDGQLAFVLVKDFRFHPPVVTIKSGGTVVFVYADTDQNQQHDPRASGPCATGSALPEPELCVPTWFLTGVDPFCFDIAADDGSLLTYNGQTYPVTLKYLPASGVIQKSRGFMSGTIMGDLTGAKPFTTCAPGSGYNAPAESVVPYHCGLHGAPSTATKEMRGTIIVTA